ncbi:MAG TPA: DNA translocase FtsK 4TM domain-containing protein [Chlamydiales bacterium]|nr:DNA translocase FtsK 4TM domain-containing protein [Chlamydiales bacterium]
MAKKLKAKRKPIPNDAKAIIYLVSAFLSFISLASFTFLDPSVNWLGYIGYIAALGSVYLFGLASYLLPAYLFWLGATLLTKKKNSYTAYDHIHFFILLISCAALLTVFADSYPDAASRWSSSIISEKATFYLHTVVRHNLGGIPCYFLYADLPVIPLQRILNPTGCTLIFSSLALISFLFLTRVPLWTVLQTIGQASTSMFRTFLQWIKKKRVKPIVPKATKSVKINLPVEKKLEEIITEERFKPKIIEAKPQPILKKEPIAVPTKSLILPSSSNYSAPHANLLSSGSQKTDQPTLKKDLMHQAAVLEETLRSFGIDAKVGEINSGPTITSFEVHPSVGVKVQKIKALENDIALNMQAKSIRIVAPIPGKAAVGVEVPAIHPQEVNFKEMLNAYTQKGKKMQIPILLGKAINGDWVFSDLAKMPHLLIAGATGSGKSVCVNTIVMSILMNARPEEVKFLMIDPKKVELTQYSRLPHMIAPVITEAHGAYAALQWLVKEMQVRYEILKQLGLRNISSFNSRTINKELESSLGIPVPEHMPFIVAMVDEFADLMMVSSADIETPIARIAQMARAVGIHLILATQRPSREVITGIIKANIPTRISFKVASRINSQIILDDVGAESLLGNGDLLFLPPGSSQLVRAQGAYISDEDINKVIQHITKSAEPNYLIPSFDSFKSLDLAESSEPKGKDSLYEQALNIVVSSKNASTTYLQRKLKIGYARAAGLMDELEENGIISPADGAKPRRILSTQGTLSIEELDDEIS